MARRDIMPWKSPNNAGELLAFPVGVTETFLEGEPVVLTAGGALDEAADDPAAIVGIAAVPAIRNTFSGAAYATGTMLQVYGIPSTQGFIATTFATDGAGTAAVPTQANAINELAGLTLTGGNWFVDTGCGNLICRIDDVLDIRKNSLSDPNILTTAGVYVLFRFV